ncbi:MAG: quinol:cytochrome C oxidoreductase [Chitinophagaceae bacterium]|nr:MAG: quinol:cytochrome C oxidoreductase [Bacteroidetes bacterium OLB11]MCC6448166.1 quinol:cytochrome C oxidoreductase [Chitinophagaceae bacterium]HMN33748.1 quinol:cytochrome C oxidoreductase [Chitinophagaceae bacterium]
MLNQEFKIPAKLKTTSLALLAIGVITLLAGIFLLLMSKDQMDQTRFWASLLTNSIFFLLLCLASVFILSATSLAQAAWIVTFRRIPESIGSVVWVFALIAGIILLTLVWTDNTNIYAWLQDGYNPKNSLNALKNIFLSKPFFTIWTILVLVLWSWFGTKIYQLSIQQDKEKKGDTKIYWKNFNVSAGFIFVFALTLASTIPWLWIMSLDSHWFSTMFSWYTFASSFVSGMSLILIWMVYLKKDNQYLDIVNDEHIHDVGKFMFAFSIFWTYLWFSQFMLIWYANIPEETVYFQIRMNGPYKIFFWVNIVLNFVAPILILMPRPTKRNYFVVTLVAVIILLGHWIDFYQMVMPSTVKENWHLGWYEIGIVCGFIGLVIYLVSNKLTKAPLVPQNNPMMKESIIHIS